MNRITRIIIVFVSFFILNSCGISKSIQHKPILTGYNNQIPEVIKHNDSLFSSGKNYLIKNKQQLWELHVSGDALERGLTIGSLTQPLIQKQEKVFFSKIESIVPSKFKLSLLRQFLKWYNRKLYLHVPEEFKAEIYGVSQYASDDYEKIAPKYLRSLYLHGAHDIGHALQDLALVGCSSLAVWGDKSEDGSLVVGRNFDFYAGDEFAEDKIIAFITPTTGIPFMSVTWGGMIGVVSGMNKEGLSITINAGKSEIPLVAKTPISILAREILQYASTTDEAIAIAKKREVFIAESIMVSSAKDKKVILIEVSPENFGVFEVENSNQLVCSNHFQSESYKDDKRNIDHIVESHSKYRFDRMNELLSAEKIINPGKVASILRNKEGLNNLDLGYGNEKALNQLLAHHGIIFKPEQRMVWVSSNPYQLGEFVAYDLNKIFSLKEINFKTVGTNELNIPEDNFIHSKAFENYENYRVLDREIDFYLENKQVISPETIKTYQKANPNLWLVYYKIGKYYYNKGWFKAAELQFEKALTKEITTLPSKLSVEKYLKIIKRKID
ncbi:MAG: C45 family peptidase [Flavobacterium sp.]|jgi:predicted choloylglycine hydrolase